LAATGAVTPSCRPWRTFALWVPTGWRSILTPASAPTAHSGGRPSTRPTRQPISSALSARPIAWDCVSTSSPILPIGVRPSLGGAKSLSIDDKVGNFEIGKEADFAVLDWAATDLQHLRQQHAKSLEDKLFALMILGDDRNVDATYVDGKLVYSSTDHLVTTLT